MHFARRAICHLVKDPNSLREKVLLLKWLSLAGRLGAVALHSDPGDTSWFEGGFEFKAKTIYSELISMREGKIAKTFRGNVR